jgi:hypothetical protein
VDGIEEDTVTQERYFQWREIWEVLAEQKNPTLEMERIHPMLNALWQEDRAKSNEKELAAHAAAWELSKAKG